MNTEPIDIPSESQAVVVRESQAVTPANLFGASDAVAVVQKAATVAKALRDVIEQQNLISTISGKKYPKCEAWTLLGTMLGVFPVLQWTRQIQGGWEARVEAKTRDGAVVGAAEAECLRSEKNWSNRDDFALRSMAQTRATAKALRMPLGFVMTLGGYEATPAEEMTFDHVQKPLQRADSTSRSGSPPTTPKLAPAPKASTGEPTIEHLEKLKTRLLEALGDNKELCQSFMRSIDWLMPNESIDALELRYVPVSKEQFDLLMAALHADEPTAPYPPNPVPLPPRKPKSAVKEATEKAIEAEEPAKPLDWWRSVIVPIPHKGQKRDEYLKNPETIGQLYDLRHGNDEESQTARQRLWGFLEHYEPKGWTKRDGTEMPPSAADLQFKEALDACRAWHETNHPDEKI